MSYFDKNDNTRSKQARGKGFRPSNNSLNSNTKQSSQSSQSTGGKSRFSLSPQGLELGRLMNEEIWSLPECIRLTRLVGFDPEKLAAYWRSLKLVDPDSAAFTLARWHAFFIIERAKKALAKNGGAV